MNEMGTHDELEMLSAYLDDEVGADERARIDAHLPTCATCRRTLDALRATTADLALLTEPDVPAMDAWALRGAISRERATQGRIGKRIAALSGAAAALALIAFGVASIAGGSGTRQTADAPAELGGISALEGPSLFTAQDGNYDADAAAGLLRSRANARRALTNAEAQSDSAPASADDRYVLGTGDAAAISAADIQRIQACEAELGNSKLEARAYIVARFEGTPADFMIYFVPGPNRHFEMWVVDRTCYVLFLAQEPA